MITALDLSSRFPKEYEDWEKSKDSIEHRFQKIIFQQKAKIYAKIEQDLNNRVRRDVVKELLKAFP